MRKPQWPLSPGLSRKCSPSKTGTRSVVLGGASQPYSFSEEAQRLRYLDDSPEQVVAENKKMAENMKVFVGWAVIFSAVSVEQGCDEHATFLDVAGQRSNGFSKGELK
jgi:hypothetical protein